MIEVENKSKNVKIERRFSKLLADAIENQLVIFYEEVTTVEGEVLKVEQKQYARDYKFWEASELGQAIIGMVGLDLSQQDPSAPRT